MKQTIYISLLTISVAWSILATISLSDQRDRNQILLWENINLRGYKDAYMEHIPKCDTLHQKCFSMENFKTDKNE